MKYFRITWSWYEDVEYYIFAHKTKTQSEFLSDWNNLLISKGDEYIQQEEECWVGAKGWIEHCQTYMENLGYERIEFIDWEFFGGYILTDKCTDGFEKIVGETLIEKAIQHNIKIEQEMGL